MVHSTRFSFFGQGSCHPLPVGITGLVQTRALMEDKSLTVAAAPALHPAPLPVPATPQSSTNNLTPLSLNDGGHLSRPNSLPEPPAGVQPVALEEHVAHYQQQRQPAAALAITETTLALSPPAVGSSGPPSSISPTSCVSLSDFSRPSSSLFSRSTSLSSSRRSFLSGNTLVSLCLWN